MFSRANERERQSLTTERDRQNSAIRTFETSLHQMELRERDLNNEIREKSALEERVETMRTEVTTFTAKMKVIVQ